ncbi:MAG: PqqD family protein [Lachnospiraceae bacterium]|nr:PqqD family protein [Lachnospiraceae bacterium]
MDKNAVVKLITDINVTELAGEKVMIDFATGKYFMIKGVGNDIWDMIQNEISVGAITEKLLSEYDVTEDVCYASVCEFLNKLEEIGFVVVK